MKKPRSLTVALALSFLALAGGVILIAAPLGIYSNFRNQRNIINGQQQLIAQNAANVVKSFVQEKFNILDATGKLVDPMSISQEKQRAALERLLGLESSFRQIILLDEEKQELTSASRLSKEASGRLLDRVDAEDLFSQVEKGSEYISSVYIDEASSEPMVVSAVPVKNIFGDFQGTLLAELNLKFMWDLVAGIKVGSSGLTYVVDRQGTLLAFRDISRVLRGENVSSLKEVEEFTKGVNGTQEDQAIITKGVEGGTVLSTHVHLNFPDWAVIVESPIMEAYSSVIQAVAISLVAVVLSLVVTVVIGFFLSRRITKPIIDLKDAAVELSKGNLTTQIKIKSQDEIGQLAFAFNEMTVKLRDSYSALEKQVEELKKAKEKISEGWLQLQKEKAKLTASIENLPLGFSMVDVSEKVMVANPQVQRILGCKDAQTVYERLKGLLKGRLDVSVYIRDCNEKSKNLVFGDLALTDGRTLRILLSPIITAENDKKKCIGIVILIEDITEARILERSRDEFFSIASHELRTPLTAIKGNTSLIEQYYGEKLKDQELKDMIADIHESSDRLIQIVNDFLDMSRLEQGKIKFSNQPLNIAELIESVIKELSTTGSERKLMLEYNKDPKVQLPAVFADSDKTKQVLINLVGNALKYTDKGGVTITTQIVPGFLKVFISDTGKGIPVANQNLLFRKFQQAGSSLLTRDTSKGTGLGLYISRLIIEGMGGKIWLEKSDEGKGSTFAFCLPIAKEGRGVDNKT